MLQKAMMSTVSKKVKRFLLEMETDQRRVQEGPGKIKIWHIWVISMPPRVFQKNTFSKK